MSCDAKMVDSRHLYVSEASVCKDTIKKILGILEASGLPLSSQRSVAEYVNNYIVQRIEFEGRLNARKDDGDGVYSMK